MHVLRMLIKLASLVHKCSGEEHFLALWNLARRGARVFTSSSPDSACWKEGSWHTCSDEFRCKNSALALGSAPQAGDIVSFCGRITPSLSHSAGRNRACNSVIHRCVPR